MQRLAHGLVAALADDGARVILAMLDYPLDRSAVALSAAAHYAWPVILRRFRDAVIL